MESLGTAQVADYKRFRTVNTSASCSMIHNNLTTSNGKLFAMVKNTKEGGQIHVYNEQLVDKKEDQIESAVKEGHKTDAMHVKYIKLNNNTYLIVCHMSVCLVFN